MSKVSLFTSEYSKKVNVEVFEQFVSCTKPKEIIQSTSMQELELMTCGSCSYRESQMILKRFLHLSDNELSTRTLSYDSVKAGEQLTKCVSNLADKILLSSNGFNIDGSIKDETRVTEFVGDAKKHIPRKAVRDKFKNHCLELLEIYNSKVDHSETIQKDAIADMEYEPKDCVYIAIDDVGVSHQKDSRKENIKKSKRVENTVINVQFGVATYIITGIGILSTLRLLLAFLVKNNLLSHQLIFFSDGATNIKTNLEKMFSFVPYKLYLDWFHLQKHVDENLCMAFKKKKKEEIRPHICRALWVGNIDEVKSVLSNVPSQDIKSQKVLNDCISYLERKKPHVTCYALRKLLGYYNSSSRGEKSNDIVVAKRQKHNGMSWSYNGSHNLAIITAASNNMELRQWINTGTINFELTIKNAA